MKLDCKQINDWPKLAWLAQFTAASEVITVYHGPCVETNPSYCVEAVWAGDFSQADFDRTDLIIGSGIRCRDERAIFVNSGTTMDRLWYCQHQGCWYVSNSLPALLAGADLTLEDNYRYPEDIKTVCRGLENYVSTMPTTGSDIHVLYFDNLVFEKGAFRQENKPDSVTKFANYQDYYDFLTKTAEHFQVNMNDAGRRHQIHPLTTVSSGYDSCAAAVIARSAGCRQAVTINQSSSLWRGGDSGEAVARHLGLACTAYPRQSRHYPWEHAIWAAAGRAGILNWTLFDYPQPLCMLFTGCRGDTVWSCATDEKINPFQVPSVADLGLTEYRLIRGIFNCAVPFWGIRHVDEIRALSNLPEMAPWRLNNNYDRPVARRMVEEAGVPRSAFGIRKKNVSIETSFQWTWSREATRSFRQYLRQRQRPLPPQWVVGPFRRLAALDKLIYMNVTSRLHLFDIGLRWRFLTKQNSLFFHWGNHQLKDIYKQAYDQFLRSSHAALS